MLRAFRPERPSTSEGKRKSDSESESDNDDRKASGEWMVVDDKEGSNKLPDRKSPSPELVEKPLGVAEDASGKKPGKKYHNYHE